MLTGRSYRTAARRIRSRPGSFGSRPAFFVIMIRMPTAPGVFFQSAMTSATAGSSGSTGLMRANRPGWLARDDHVPAVLEEPARLGEDPDLLPAESQGR